MSTYPLGISYGDALRVTPPRHVPHVCTESRQIHSFGYILFDRLLFLTYAFLLAFVCWAAYAPSQLELPSLCFRYNTHSYILSQIIEEFFTEILGKIFIKLMFFLLSYIAYFSFIKAILHRIITSLTSYFKSHLLSYSYIRSWYLKYVVYYWNFSISNSKTAISHTLFMYLKQISGCSTCFSMAFITHSDMTAIFGLIFT